MGSYIYFIQEGMDGPIKIGTATDPLRRLASLQTGNPRLLLLMGICEGDRETEAEIHRKLAKSHITGEWFLPADEVKETIFSLCQTAPEEDPEPVEMPELTDEERELYRTISLRQYGSEEGEQELAERFRSLTDRASAGPA